MKLITPTSWRSFVVEGDRRIVMVKMVGCAPCARATPMFEHLSEKIGDDVCGILVIDSKDPECVQTLRDMQVRGVPSFDVYENGTRVFRSTTTKKLREYLGMDE